MRLKLACLLFIFPLSTWAIDRSPAVEPVSTVSVEEIKSENLKDKKGVDFGQGDVTLNNTIGVTDSSSLPTSPSTYFPLFLIGLILPVIVLLTFKMTIRGDREEMTETTSDNQQSDVIELNKFRNEKKDDVKKAG